MRLYLLANAMYSSRMVQLKTSFAGSTSYQWMGTTMVLKPSDAAWATTASRAAASKFQ
ncbi:hypothetical protein [Duganella radicis]|uniref:Uncharacterized protein n=1 Tax=Duganella radicis TaxID=551988 RepID=A0A6L6PQF6_9BURK|nr:hypothetical protein [Duganella radicis]MTV41039.1 hypothetical protein [Duganella radicis]